MDGHVFAKAMIFPKSAYSNERKKRTFVFYYIKVKRYVVNSCFSLCGFAGVL